MDIKTLGENILNALRNVGSSQLGKDVVSAGSVKNLKIKQGNVSFELAVPSPDSPGMDELKAHAIEEVRSLEGVENVDVAMVPGARKEETQGEDPWAGRAPIPGVKNIIAVASGKGGVGKSTMAVNLAAALAARGVKTGLLDADIYGPSVAMMMGIPHGERPDVKDNKVIPIKRYEVSTISIAFLLSESNTPVIWRGPMVGKLLKQLLTDVDWGELDTIVVDLPPGTGDAQLTLIQSVPIDGSIIVTTPQKLAALDAIRGIEMFRKMQVPVLGVVENMSKFITPDGVAHNLFPRDGINQVQDMYNVPVLASVPIEPSVAEQGDNGYPIVLSDPGSDSSKEIYSVADSIITKLELK